MIVYPAMDLIGGRPVRLIQGRFDQVAGYPADPVEAVLGFERAGAECVHIVDLDGAREGGPRQHGLIVDIALSVSIDLQVAGGFREPEHLKRMFDAGVDRVVIGSLAVKQPALVREFFSQFGGDRIVLALDVNLVDGEPMVATAGWTEASGRSLWEIAALYPEARHILVTDIGRDGMMKGPNVDLMRETVERLPLFKVQASGGVSSLADLEALRDTGAAGAIVGKALWEERFSLEEAIRHARR
jgi:phosphoribosylformimino-5-aminoimidazole carboxamide ribotide isomerase